ncbi:MAG: adenylate kinase family protein [Candidatus Bathyarchaeia archaeon]
MSRLVVLVTGTPCVGKTSVSKLLVDWLDAVYINLTDLAVNENLVLGEDMERKSIIFDEGRVKRRIREIILENLKRNVVVDGHAAGIVPKRFVTYAFVLRRDPVELLNFMVKSGFSGRKLWENLASEILDVCLVEALKAYGEGRVCEVNVSGRSVEDVASEILEVLKGSKKCRLGIVDWLGKLESEGRLEEFLRI